MLPFKQFAKILGNRVFFYAMCSLCFTYFSSVALQFWITNYMITVIKMTPPNAHMVFGFVCISAPLLGAYFGGYLTDSLVSQLL